jgi:hypothetical protein
LHLRLQLQAEAGCDYCGNFAPLLNFLGEKQGEGVGVEIPRRFAYVRMLTYAWADWFIAAQYTDMVVCTCSCVPCATFFPRSLSHLAHMRIPDIVKIRATFWHLPLPRGAVEKRKGEGNGLALTHNAPEYNG